MGCFSYLCKKSGKAALSTSFSGSAVYIFLLKKGKCLEMMYGNYDSYGRVFKKTNKEGRNDLRDSFEWVADWLSFSFDYQGCGDHSGFAFVLAEHWDGVIPTTTSEHDPNQGWGSGEEEEDCFGSTSAEAFPWVPHPFHVVFDN